MINKLVLLALLLSLCGTLGAAEQQYASASARMAAIGTFTSGGPNTFTQTSTNTYASGGGSAACAVAGSEAKVTKPYVAVGAVGGAVTASITSGEGDAGITSGIGSSLSDGVSCGGSGYAAIGGITATQTGNNLNGIAVSDGIEIDN